MTIVVDASVALLWVIDVPASRIGERVLQRNETILAPDLIIPETANALWKSVVYADLSSTEAELAIESLNRYFTEIVPTAPLRIRALSIALELKHPAYDCFYLALAEERSSSLITADQRLLRRCRQTAFEEFVQELA